MAEQIFFFIVYIFGAVIAYIYFYENYELKLTQTGSFLIATGLYIIGFLFNLVFDNNFIINQCAFFIINILYCKISFNISFKSSIFHSSILLAIMFITEMIVEAGASLLLHIPIDAYKNSLTALVILGIICKVLYFTVCKIISTAFSYKKNNATNDIKKNLVLFIYPIIITAMLSVILYASATYKFSKTVNFVCITISIISLIFCCIIFIINKNFQKQENELISLQAENQRNEMNQVFYEMLEKKNDEQRILVHDIKHHLAAINTMDNIPEINDYIRNILPELNEHKFIGKTKNKMFDLILDRYSSICETKSIKFTVDIRFSNLSFIQDKDLVSMLSNILDNAIEAVESIENPSIRLSTKQNENFVILSVVNSCIKKPNAFGEKLITTKADSKYHGYGLKSIEKTANKYNGLCQWNFDEQNYEFQLTVIFNK